MQWASVNSYALEFLPLAFPQGSDHRKHFISLGCGFGTDLVAARIFFGDGIKLSGVDNHSNIITFESVKQQLKKILI